MLIILQARLGSSRLPKKALLPIGTEPSIVHTFRALKNIPSDDYFLATDEKSYSIFFPLAKKEGFKVFVGNEENVLERFCFLIEAYIKEKKSKNIENLFVLRATADNPFLFFEAAIELIAQKDLLFKQGLPCDYLTFTGLPHGSGIEIFKASSLLKAWKKGTEPYEKEHVSPALYNHTNDFACHFLEAPKNYFAAHLRTTIDTNEDYKRSLKLYRHLMEQRKKTQNIEKKSFTAKEILDCLAQDAFVNPIFYVPKVEKSFGTGHFRRALLVAKELDAYIFINHQASNEIKALLQKAIEKEEIFEDQILTKNTDIKSFNPALIVLDNFKSKKQEIEHLSKIAPLILVDEGSFEKNHKAASYVLDIIPSLKEKKRNLQEIGLLDFRSCQKRDRQNIKETDKKRVLISLGGEDPAVLGKKAKELMEKVFEKFAFFYEIEVLSPENPIDFLKEKLWTYDLVITHYGLTAFEALVSACQVLLLGTSKIHEKLAKKYGFNYIPKRKMKEKSFEKIILPIISHKKPSSKKTIHPIFSSLFEMDFATSETQSQYSQFLSKLSLGEKIDCPLCTSKNMKKSKKNDDLVERTANKTIRKCNNCNLFYPSWREKANIQYSEAYFFDSYKNQYGKTYLEDFSQIKTRGKERIKTIKALKPVFSSILDIGCAYGPFLDAARDAGFEVYGTDISQEAVEYVEKKLKIPALFAEFPDSFPNNELFSNKTSTTQVFPLEFGIITMWFVIEHFENLDAVLKKVNELLPIAGLFAFSTPNAAGISSKINKKAFFEQSPLDHLSLWHKKAAKKILKAYGFRIKKIKIEEKHIERLKMSKYFFWIYYLYQKSGIWKKIAIFFANFWLLSDTFEIYCMKTHNIL